jgi:hypothetical protein
MVFTFNKTPEKKQTKKALAMMGFQVQGKLQQWVTFFN